MRMRTMLSLLRKKATEDEEGMTIIEVLTALILLVMVATILFSFLFMGISMYKRVTAESQLRNQGDAIFSQVISELKDAIYVKNGEVPNEIEYAKRNTGADQYVDQYSMRVLPVGGTAPGETIRYGIDVYEGQYDVSKTPLKRIALTEAYTLRLSPDFPSLSASGNERVRLHLVYEKILEDPTAAERAENKPFEISTTIPLFRSE